MKLQKGFTLIELLIVIGIVAILAVVVVLTINPAELLRQARDSNRISDLKTMSAALSIYLADVPSPVLETNYSRCSVSFTSASTTATCGGRFTGMSTTSIRNAADYRKNDGSGWIPVNFKDVSSGAPFGQLPVDPVNSQVYYYSYAASSSLTFEINANMESERYRSGGSADVESNSKDGGNSDTVYEVGTVFAL